VQNETRNRKLSVEKITQAGTALSTNRNGIGAARKGGTTPIAQPIINGSAAHRFARAMSGENRSPEARREALEVLVASTVAVAVLILLATIVCMKEWNRHCPKAIDPCVEAGRGQRIVASGIPFGCTGDPTNYRG